MKITNLTDLNSASANVLDRLARTVIVETMPVHLRASHRAAGNWGQYPINGATRSRVDIDEAEAIVDEDADGYDHVIEGSEQ